ncbi:Dystrobrevin betalike [Caligus rogercresseyi]|uniref:Dystrobrevin betalike n=1 Tax=Caligus rogercresseyi TaxID=217165 RepID=A0A7T8HM75_CALRO|nr:Dystrobrevin betalike [Caligus rogercresseyi]
MDDLETSGAEVQGEEDETETSLEKEVIEEDQESIRFPSYRTASKLRSLQKRSLLHHIDIWNMIEAFRENGLNEVSREGSLGQRRLRELLSSLYVSLGKRLPPGPAIRDEENVLYNWILALCPKTKVRSVKTALTALAAGKLMDKLRYVFSQCADSNGLLSHKRFAVFLRDLLKIPHSLGEYEAYTSPLEPIFPSEARVNVNDFLETMMSDPGPACLSWLLVLHRIINAEGVHHPVSCGSCNIKGFNGLRYKSDRANLHLCQNCFWRGRIGMQHREDVFKEYNSFKSTSGRSSFKKSLQCIGGNKDSSSLVSVEGTKISRSKGKNTPIPSFQSGNYLCPTRYTTTASSRQDPHPGATRVPDSPLSTGIRLASRMDARGPQRSSSNTNNGLDEHSLIAEYTQSLANRNQPHPRQLVQELERKNQEIIRDITKLRSSGNFSYPSLHGLRTRKDDLDQRLYELQSTRRDLMTELEELMKLLKNQRGPSSSTQESMNNFTWEKASSKSSNGGCLLSRTRGFVSPIKSAFLLLGISIGLRS